MPGSSELSDALNPYFYQQEQRPQVNFSPNHTRVPATALSNSPQHPPIQQFTPSRSELADAINPAAISPSPAARRPPVKHSRQHPADALQLLKGLIQSIASYKAAVEQEKKRRLAWEQEQETKYIARQTELEQRVTELQQELDALRAEHDISQVSSVRSPQESSVTSVSGTSAQVPGECLLLFEPKDNETDPAEFVEGSSSSSISQKRARSGSPPGSSEQEPIKLRTHRSTRPQTIQTAMRNHILRCMDLDHDKELPPSHEEFVKLPPSRPVRFVWDQTTKKSPHNGRMKSRIISDMIVKKELYPLVPSQEFTHTKLDGVFEQAYTTLRQKYAAQQGLKAESKDRTDSKVQRARRLSRKKTKLGNRIATRKQLDHYNNCTFDVAFQLDCMSSEESSDEEVDEPDKPSTRSLRIRFLAWRSSRLHELFRAIDEYEQYNRGMKPKRGVGRKDRHMGPAKDGNPPPPKGTPQWMVSKKWLRQASAINPRIASLVTPNDENAAQALSILGEESNDEQEVRSQPDYPQMPVPDFSMIERLAPMNADEFHHAQYMYAQHAAWADPMAAYVDLSHFSSPPLQTYPPVVPHTS